MPKLGEHWSTATGAPGPCPETDHVEFYVGNARQAAHYYRTAFGMKLTAYLGPETGIEDRASYMVAQGRIRFVFTSALRHHHPVSDHVYRYGDGIHGMAFLVPDATTAYFEAREDGSRIVQEPTELRDENGLVRLFAVAAYGNTVRTYIDRSQYDGAFLPGFAAAPEHDTLSRPTGLEDVDAFRHFESWDGSPAGVPEFAELLASGCIQQLTLSTGDIFQTVERMRNQGVEFLPVPPGYYQALLSPGTLPLERMQRLDIRFDARNGGRYLALTKPVEDRPGLFFEVTQPAG